MLAVVLALLSSLFWGSADFGGGLASRRVPAAAVVLLSQASGAAVLLGVCVAVRQPFPRLFWLAMAAGLFGLVGLLLFYRGLAIGTMSLVAPVAACGAVVPVVYDLFSGQALRPLTLAGLASAMAGVVLASISSTGAAKATVAPPRPRAAVVLAVGAAGCFGMFLLLLGRAAHVEPGSVLWLSLCTRLASVPALGLGLALTRSAPPWRGLDVRLGAGIALVGLGDATANTLFALAGTLGSLAVVAVLGSLYPLATALLARFNLGERLTALQKAGAGLAMVGVVMVSVAGSAGLSP